MRILLATFSALAVAAPIAVATAAGNASHSVKKYAAKQHQVAKTSSTKQKKIRPQKVAHHGVMRMHERNGEVVVEQRGKASYYADRFHGRRTATGDLYNRNKLTAASNVMPMGSWVKVTNLKNGRTVQVLINDKGPHGGGGRVIDLSRRAAEDLGMYQAGVVPVVIEAKPSAQLAATLREQVQEVAAAP